MLLEQQWIGGSGGVVDIVVSSQLWHPVIKPG